MNQVIQHNQNQAISKEEKVRKIIQSYIEREGVYESLLDLLGEKNQDFEDIDYQTMMDLLEKQYPQLFENIIEDLQNLDKISDLKEGEAQEEYEIDINLERKPQTIRQFMFQINGASQFKDLLNTENVDEKVQIFISWLNQKFQSKPVELDVNPKFDDLFVFELESFDSRSPLDLNLLKKLDQKVELAVCIVNMKTRERQIYALKQIEWRFILTYPVSKMNIELGKYENEDKRAGILSITMELFPKIQAKKLLNENDVQNQLKKEIEYKDIDIKAFYQYSKKWWNEFKEKYPGYENRVIKIYTENEFGMYIPTCSYLSPLYDVKGIDTVEMAARFVSLIPYKFSEIELGEKKEIWSRFQNIMINRGGDYQDHATLLASFFLGFNLDAFVVVGSNSKGLYHWVMTRERQKQKMIHFYWDPMTGKKYCQQEMGDAEKLLFKKIGCVFNQHQFYANIQNYDYAISCDFSFSDRKKWERLNEDHLAKIKPYNKQLILTYPSININKIETFVNKTLKNYIMDYRMIHGMTTRYDDNLEAIFKPKLASCEHELIYDQKLDGNFQQAISGYLAQGHNIKQVFMQFNHFDIKKMFLEIKNNELGKLLLHLKGVDRLYFGAKCKLIPYPDNFFVIWVVLFAKYKKA